MAQLKEDDGLEPVDYLGFTEDLIRVSHDTSVLSTNVLQLEPPLNPRQQELVKQEIRQRKKVMAGLDLEINELESLLEHSF